MCADREQGERRPLSLTYMSRPGEQATGHRGESRSQPRPISPLVRAEQVRIREAGRHQGRQQVRCPSQRSHRGAATVARTRGRADAQAEQPAANASDESRRRGQAVGGHQLVRRDQVRQRCRQRGEKEPVHADHGECAEVEERAGRPGGHEQDPDGGH
jgi:hypothetical protein